MPRRPYCVCVHLQSQRRRLSVAAVASVARAFSYARGRRGGRARMTIIHTTVFFSRRPYPKAAVGFFFFFFLRAPYNIIRRRRGVHVRRVFRPVPANLVPRCNGLPVHRRVHHHNDTSARRAAEVRRVAAVRRARPGRRMSGRR